MTIIDYSTTPSSNTSLFPENMAPSAVNNGMRQVQADIRDGVVMRRDTKAIMSAIDPSNLAAGDRVYINYRSTEGDGGGGFFRVTKSDISTEVAADAEGGTYIPFDASPGDGSNGGFIREFVGPVYPEWYGAVADGSTDDTAAIDSVGANYVTFASGDYKYAGTTTLDIDKITLQNGADIVGYSTDIPITFRYNGEFKGLHHNYNETKYAAVPLAAITTGDLKSPPISTASSGCVDVMAHWYNDFGLDCTRQADGGLGSVKWYTWEWNHTDTVSAEGYLPDRNSAFGFYRGDDPVVLDWICYSLREAGVTAVNLIGSGADFTDWTTPDDLDYWKYVLFTNVPNFKGLRYVLPVVTTGVTDLATAKAKFDISFTNIYSVYDNYYTMERDGKNYIVIYMYDGGSFRATLGTTDTLAFFAYCATQLKTLGEGIDGAAFLARNANSTTFINNGDGVEDGWLYMSGDYANCFGTTSDTTYDDLVSTFGASVPSGFEIMVPNIMTSRESHSFHPSTLSSSGHTPDKFYKMALKAVNLVKSDKHLYPNLITVGNVSEWAEQGPGLAPNAQDGFAYGEALRRAVTGSRSVASPTMTRQTVAAADAIISKTPVVRISGASTFSFTSTPTIEAGIKDGQMLTIIGGGGFTYTVQDEGTLPGSNVETASGSNLAIAAGTAFQFVWDAAATKWFQIG